MVQIIHLFTHCSKNLLQIREQIWHFYRFFSLSPLYILLSYLGIGIRKGMVHLVWNLGWYSRTELTIPTPTVKINDGNWHMLKVDRVRQSLDVEIDGEVYNSRVTGSYYELNTANSVLLGKKNQKMYLCV